MSSNAANDSRERKLQAKLEAKLLKQQHIDNAKDLKSLVEYTTNFIEMKPDEYSKTVEKFEDDEIHA